MEHIELNPIKETPHEYAELESIILKLFREEIYWPILKELKLNSDIIQNSSDALSSAIKSGRIYFYRGQFKGNFSATLSRELRSLGAKWDRKQGSFRIPQSLLPPNIVSEINVSEYRFVRTATNIDRLLSQLLPENIAGKLSIEKFFDTTLFKVNKRFEETIKGITVAPKFTPDQAQRISKEYEKNIQLYIQKFTEKEIISLRQKMIKSAFSGNRYENMIKTIKQSYGVSHNKAKFLARQETGLLMAKFKQTRYEDAGVNEYKWCCVVGSPNHPVRPMHKALDGKTFTWSNPPITDDRGNRNNPGQDYTCRCFARPIVRFRD